MLEQMSTIYEKVRLKFESDAVEKNTCERSLK